MTSTDPDVEHTRHTLNNRYRKMYIALCKEWSCYDNRCLAIQTSLGHQQQPATSHARLITICLRSCITVAVIKVIHDYLELRC